MYINDDCKHMNRLSCQKAFFSYLVCRIVKGNSKSALVPHTHNILLLNKYPPACYISRSASFCLSPLRFN